MAENNATPAPADNGKTVAWLAYATLIGFIIALIMNNGNKTKLGSYHLRQALGLWVFSIAVNVALTILIIVAGIIANILAQIVSLVSLVAMLFILYIWIMGLLAALKGEEKPMPVIGKMIEEKLGKVFA